MIGSVIDGRYRITGTVGAGGMGSVYQTEHTGTGRRVALKLILAAEAPLSPQAIGRFQREAKAAGAIETQHIAQVLDFGTDPATNAPYLAMELLTGEDLRALSQRIGPIAPDLALRIVAQACIGPQKAHEAHVISARSVRTGVVRIATDGLLALPDDEHPEICIVEARDGQWTIEADGMVRVALENESILVGDETWALDVPRVAISTLAVESVLLTLESIILRFAVSGTENDDVVITVDGPGKKFQLPPQKHHRLLLALAREQLSLAALPPAERGWTDRHRVCRLLAISEQRLNVDICHARREFAALGIHGAANVIETRPGTTMLRLGVGFVEVTNVSS